MQCTEINVQFHLIILQYSLDLNIGISYCSKESANKYPTNKK